ncbi:DNA-binding protein [Xanthomonas sp. WHRI 1810A]|uniref:DNA-binding protein n=1 Tax=Xanthomonas sp. WHRI 1810A TaxID=3161565 RepID=UPI0032E937AB
MARGGVNKATVQTARDSLLARGENPSIDAVRVELGNTGSKSTIHRYLKEIDAHDPRPKGSSQQVSDELTALVSSLLARLLEEGAEVTAQAQARFDQQRVELEAQQEEARAELAALQSRFDAQRAALDVQTGELQTSQSSLQSELTRNARLSQHCADLEVRVQEKDEQVRSLEEKHLHARDALEHYRNAVKEQREQELRRHEGQLQQVQVELRQLQQMQVVKQDELTRLNRDNERLLAEARQQGKAVSSLEAANQRLTGQITALQTTVAKAEGAKDMLQAHIAQLRDEAKALATDMATEVALANEKASEAAALLDSANAALETLRQETPGQARHAPDL